MEWTEQLRAEIEREYTRIGYVPGELWPAPPDDLIPEDLLALFRRIPDEAGRAWYVAELAKSAR